MAVGGDDRLVGMTDGPEWRTAWLCGRWHSHGCRGSPKGGIPARAMIPKTRHSRGSGNLETFATGRVGIGRAALGSWSPIGVGDELRGNDGGAVDSRFRGNDRWVGMVEGGDGGWAGMVVGGSGGWAGIVEGGNGGRRGWWREEKALLP